MRNNLNTQDQHKISEGNNQLVLVLNSEILLPEDAPVRVTSTQLEELDYGKLYEAYSSKGRKSVTDPRVLFKVMAYGYRRYLYADVGRIHFTALRGIFDVLQKTGSIHHQRSKITAP